MRKKQYLVKKDKKYIWHPFTQMQDWLKDDILIIDRGRGNYLYDIKGRRYLDGVSSLWCNVHGHRKEPIDRAIRKQLNQIAHSTMLGLSHPTAIKLAEQLIKITPTNLTRVFYSDDGSTAMEIALKIAFQYWQQIKRKTQDARRKTKILTLSSAYHGDTIGSVSLGGIKLFHRIYRPLLFKAINLPSPYCYRCPYQKNINDYKGRWLPAKHGRQQGLSSLEKDCQIVCLKKIERVMKKHHRQLAALVIEPLIQGAGGMITQPPGFLRRIRQLCTRYNVLLITDEVATGFGRTGKMFACQHEKVKPDIMTLSKGITGGYLPLAATLTTEKIFRAFLGSPASQKTFFHGHTYTGNPLGCAAALANLKIFRQEQVLKKLSPKIKFLRQNLRKFYQLTHVGDIRQCGLMVGIELVQNKTTKKPFPAGRRIGHRVILAARRHGVILRPLSDVIILMPPLSITIPELKKLLNVITRSIRTATENYSSSTGRI